MKTLSLDDLQVESFDTTSAFDYDKMERDYLETGGATPCLKTYRVEPACAGTA